MAALFAGALVDFARTIPALQSIRCWHSSFICKYRVPFAIQALRTLAETMTRTFIHKFEPASSSPIPGPVAELNVSEIEDAGIREVLQTPGAAYGAWSILEALLADTGQGSPFVFREPLGQAREVKVALSGLFGRFVARAYLEKYFSLSIFAHLGQSLLMLDSKLQIKLVRLSNGDLPDWIASTADLSSLTVAEAKGCHTVAGPSAALRRAWSQAMRVDVQANGKKVTVKRIAIATRWGAESTGPSTARLSVRDPEDKGEAITEQESNAIYLGLLRHHVANLIAPLGHSELAAFLRQLSYDTNPNTMNETKLRAKHLLDTASVKEIADSDQVGGLLGGVVTRAGPLNNQTVSVVDQNTLARLNLRPVFVGVERNLINSAIEADATAVRQRLNDTPQKDDVARFDRAGGWIIPLGEQYRFVKDA